jgi:hypothetical protein
VTAGLHGKIEVLGDGQQLVADGVHPSGASLYWKDGRGPDTVPRDQLPEVTEEQIGAFLNDCAALVGATSQAPTVGSRSSSSGIFEQPTGQPPSMARSTLPVENELGAGIERSNWFEALHGRAVAPRGPARQISRLLGALASPAGSASGRCLQLAKTPAWTCRRGAMLPWPACSPPE